MTSKYLLSNASLSYKNCKKFLDDGRLVLYTGISCQNHGLKKFLGKDYNNLLLVDIACHGLPPIQVWKDYFDTIRKPKCKIENINFRDKTYGWRNYSFKVEYSDGTTFIEPHKNNKYMRVFLGDNYLMNCCYDCRYKNKNSCADIVIGDFWTINNVNKNLSNDKGSSFIISRTTTGFNIVKSINKYLFLKEISCLGDPFCYVGLRDKCNKKKLKYSKDVFKKRIGIINNSFQSNMGGVIQAYALQQTLSKLGYKSFTYNANLSWAKCYLKFIDDYINVYFLGEFKKASEIPYSKFVRKDDLVALLVGSDQIWRKEWNDIDNIFLTFASSWKINKLIYGASMGTEEWNYTDEDNYKIKKYIKLFNGVSVRELDLVEKTQNKLDVRPTFVLDPTFLLAREHYKNLCRNINKRGGIFLYTLDNNEEINKIVSSATFKLGASVFTHDKEKLEDWLAGFRDADFVITDSYHGCIFSIIFGKPFICLMNEQRGLTRFKTLEKIFSLEGRFVKKNDEIDWKNILNMPDCEGTIRKLKKKSIRFIKFSLRARPVGVDSLICRKAKRFVLFIKKYIKKYQQRHK